MVDILGEAAKLARLVAAENSGTCVEDELRETEARILAGEPRIPAEAAVMLMVARSWGCVADVEEMREAASAALGRVFDFVESLPNLPTLTDYYGFDGASEATPAVVPLYRDATGVPRDRATGRSMQAN